MPAVFVWTAPLVCLARTAARSVSFPGCSHWWQLERPDDVAQELRRFW